ncbi:helix-turn-helix transcriptional regulator [Flavobacterium sp. CAU 1735]|uniref:helix-turn-helix domain-containing protein n=1 Tax=Flavobacterium sp. CAU 1735 TaxID=3140361 RepID=UPI00325FF9C0
MIIKALFLFLKRKLKVMLLAMYNVYSVIIVIVLPVASPDLGITIAIGLLTLLLILIAIIFGFCYCRYCKNERENKENFQKLFDRINDFELKNQKFGNDRKKSLSDTTTFVINDKRVNDILIQLAKLEQSKYFLSQDCTLHSVAKKLKTNTTYLSRIINKELGKSFSDYINELRISYVLLELACNKKLRAYSISAIADEIGYKSPDSFSKYFKEVTGISPSAYIRKIEKKK